MMARVRGVIAASIAAGAMLNVAGSMSTNTGVPPALWIVPAVAKKVKGVVITSSPGRRSSALSGSSKASVPLAQAMACFVCDSAGDRGLELRHLGAHDERLALDHRHHGGEHIVLDALILRDQIQQGYVHRCSSMVKSARASAEPAEPRARSNRGTYGSREVRRVRRVGQSGAGAPSDSR